MEPSRASRSYREIKQIVIERIQNQTWELDSFLPTEVELAEEFSTTRTTVNRALRELADEGYLERKRKYGTKVLRAPVAQAKFSIPLIRAEITATGADYRYSLIRRAEMTVPDWLASRMKCCADQKAVHIRCLHYANSRPFQFEDRWIMVDTVPDVVDQSFTDIGPNEWLVRTIPFSDVEHCFYAARADQTLAEFLSANTSDPIFVSERLTWLKSNPVTFARLYHHVGFVMTTNSNA